jgi:hypothetical protein
VQCLKDVYHDQATFIPLKRSLWNEADGLEYIQKLAIEDDQKQATLRAVENKCASCGPKGRRS